MLKNSPCQALNFSTCLKPCKLRTTLNGRNLIADISIEDLRQFIHNSSHHYEWCYEGASKDIALLVQT
ncbi:unnamed protein product [Rhodiola kirilowii]